ncbi:MAG: MFS transporter [Actinomycetota bacterium]
MTVKPPNATRRLRPSLHHRPVVAAFLRIFIAGFATFLAAGCVIPVLPRYVTGPLNSGPIAVGIVIGAFAISAIVSRPLAGRLADRYGRRLVMVVGTVAASCAGVLYFLPLDIPGLIFARLVLGLGEGFVFTAGIVWTVDIAPQSRRAQAIGLWGLALWTALSLGPLTGELLLSTMGYAAVWAFAAIVPLLGAAVALTIRDDHTPVTNAQKQPWVPREAVRPGVGLALTSIGWSALAGFAVLMLQGRGVGHGAAVFTAFASSVVIARLVLGRLPDRIGAARTAIGAGCVEAVGLCVVAVAGSWPVAVVGAVVVGLGFSVLYPSLALLVVDNGSIERRGAALGAFSAFFDLGIGVGAPLAGVVAVAFGYTAVFWLAAAAAAGAALLAATATRPSYRLGGRGKNPLVRRT